jgi:hypothetical protein
MLAIIALVISMAGYTPAAMADLDPSAIEPTAPAPSILSAAPSAYSHLGYSLTPSQTEPSVVCPAPTATRASCMAIGVPDPRKLASLGLAAPSYEGSGELGGFSAEDLQSAYKLPKEGGAGETIAITIAYDDPNAKADLAEYRSKYKLPACGEGCFEKVNQKGEAKNYPVANSSWAEETSLDLDMVSAACPKCHILLVEAVNSQLENLLPTVEEAAAKGAKVISDSWDSEEFSGESTYDHYLDPSGIPVLFAAGDLGYHVQWPAASPDVISVGGTSLTTSGGGERGWSEKAWSDTGSGCSKDEEKPPWQKDAGCLKRTVADVSAVAAPETPVSIYDSYEEGGWMLIGGTSAATPLVAGIEMLSSSTFRKGGPAAFTDAGEAGSLFDPSEGYDGYCDTYLCEAGPYYDGPTGWGSPDGPQTFPSALTEAGKAVSVSKETLQGAVDPQGLETKYHFEYGTTTSYGTSIPIPEGSAGSGSEYVAVARTIEGLKGQTLYHYRTVATNSEGTFHGVDRTFATTPPVVTTGTASGLFADHATVHATVDPEAFATKYYFEFGTSTSYGRVTPAPVGELSPGTTKVEVSGVPGALTGSRTYHYRIVARSVAGIAYGEDRTFTTERSQWVAQSFKPEEGNKTLRGISCISPNYCMAVGDFLSPFRQSSSERWNGSNWSANSMATPEKAKEVIVENVSCVSESWCVAVGFYSAEGTEGTEGLPLIERWNGSKWTAESVHLPEGIHETSINGAPLSGISCTSSEACMAVGQYITNSKEGPSTLPLIYRWNGTGWSSLTISPPPGSAWVAFSAVSCTSSGWCMAVGNHAPQEKYQEYNHPLAAEWNGTTWTTVLETFPLGEEGDLTAVSCTATNACSAVDRSINDLIFKEKTPPIERWNGKEWSSEALSEAIIGVDNSAPLSISCTSAVACTAVGYSSVYGGTEYVPVAFAWISGKWWVQSTPVPTQEEEGSVLSSDSLESVSCSSASSCVAAGGYLAQKGETSDMAEFYQTAPEATSEAASGVKQTEATVNGKVNPNGADTKYYFEYGPTSSYGSKTSEASAGTGTTGVKENKGLSGLEPDMVYHYRIVARNSGGTVDGADKSFTTTGWAIQSTPNPEGAKASGLEWVACPSATVCEAAGGETNSLGVEVPLAERWGGTEWSIQSTPAPVGAKESRFVGISCSSASACTAVGSYKNGSGVEVTLVESWNGSEWAIQSSPNHEGAKSSELIGVSCTSSSVCEASGYYENSSGATAMLAEGWSAGKWEVQSTPAPAGATSDFLLGVSCSSATVCMASGAYANSSGQEVPLVESWSAGKWEAQSPPNPEGAQATYLVDLSCSSATACEATGYYEKSFAYISFAEHWNGSKWVVQPAPGPEGGKESELDGISCTSANTCTSVGAYINGSGVELTLAERY